MATINVTVMITLKQYDSYYSWNSYVNYNIFNNISITIPTVISATFMTVEISKDR